VGEVGISQLMVQAAKSRELLSLIKPLLPVALAAHVRAGKLDDAGWTLMVPNGAAAAKLQQLRPDFEQHLQARGMKVSSIRIRVQGAG
jgi:Dna[CI] antecedent, DciA